MINHVKLDPLQWIHTKSAPISHIINHHSWPHSIHKLHHDNHCQCETWHLTVYCRCHLVTTAPPHTLPLPSDLGCSPRTIIRNHCSAPPPSTQPPPFVNGTNLYSLSVLMSSHAEKWSYHRPSGSHHLSPSPVGWQAQFADGQAERESGWGWEGGTHLSPFSCKLL